jgi:hypothetical protein
MSIEEQQDEMVFSTVLLNQKHKVEKECIKLQTLIDNESSNASFIWLPTDNSVNIVENFFQKSKRIREDEDDDDDDDDDDDNNNNNNSEEQENDVPENDFVPHNSNVRHNSGVHQIFMKKIGRKRSLTPEIVVPENGVVLEVKGNQSPPSFVPYSAIVNSGEQTPEHVP